MLTPTFRFFEAICSELSATESRVITGRDFEAKLGDAPLLAELREEHHSPSSFEAMRSAVDFLAKHFEERGSTLPFVYDHESGRFTAGNIDFINFIESMASIRSRGVHAQQFEIGVAEKLLRRTTGAIHRVGHPRTRNKKRAEFNAYLKGLGFRPEVLLGRKEKDGGARHSLDASDRRNSSQADCFSPVQECSSKGNRYRETANRHNKRLFGLSFSISATSTRVLCFFQRLHRLSASSSQADELCSLRTE